MPIGFLGQFAFFFGGSRDGERTNPLVAILVMIFAPLAATMVQMAISRTREFSADRLGAQICGMPRALAGALQRIEQLATGRVMPTAEHNPASAHLFIINPLRLGGVDNLFRTHPRTEDRIRALLALEQEGVGAALRPAAACAMAACRAPAAGAGRGREAAHRIGPGKLSRSTSSRLIRAPSGRTHVMVSPRAGRSPAGQPLGCRRAVLYGGHATRRPREERCELHG